MKKISFKKNKRKDKRKANLVCGYTLIYLLVIISVFMIIIYSITESFATRLRVINSAIDKEQALQIAEAGVNYYEWHLAHFPNDYKDGTSNDGPYVHDYTDFDTQNILGKFSLEITPPILGSTVVTIKSTGYTLNYPNIKRTVIAKYGIPSLTKYSILNNDPIWIYYSPSIFNGQIRSNNGIRFDVAGNAPIYSAKSTYTCPDWQKCPSKTMPGIWGSGDSSFWQFPVPAIDFSAFTSDLANMKVLSQSGGIYLPPSNKHGYSLVFNSDGTVSIYKVKNLIPNPSGVAYDTNMGWIPENQSTDYNDRDLQYQIAIPPNGIIYVEDNVWVEGTINGRVTVAVATLPYNSETAPTIYIPNNIVYKDKDGTDVLGLIGQKDIIPTYHAPNNLEVDAAIISQNASFQFFNYNGDIKNNLIIYGSIIEFGWWFDNFVWTSGVSTNVVSGYTNPQYTYDANLLYGPPPSFPFSNSEYEQINWLSN